MIIHNIFSRIVSYFSLDQLLKYTVIYPVQDLVYSEWKSILTEQLGFVSIWAWSVVVLHCQTAFFLLCGAGPKQKKKKWSENARLGQLSSENLGLVMQGKI